MSRSFNFFADIVEGEFMYKVYEWNEDEYAYEVLDEEQVEDERVIRRKHKAKKLSPQMMDMMTDEEIRNWYEHNGRYGYDG